MLVVRFHTGMNRIFLYILILTFSLSALAQSTREVEAKPSAPIYQNSKSKEKFSLAKLFKGRKDDGRKLPYELREDFEKRMKAVAKQKQVEARLAEKPQYSNKLYFGHKRKPKKRKLGKKKYCKICEFAH